MSHTNRVVVLIDMDCFYCQVEEKLDPSLEGKPIAVVQYNAWRGGGIIAVNYPAREQGVTRHMRGDEAKQKCPDIILAKVPNVRGKADLTKYREAGKRVADVLQTFTRLLERASVDEAYLDITEEVDKRLQKGTDDIIFQNMKNTFVVGYETIDFVDGIQQSIDLVGNDLKLAMGAIITEEIRAAVFKQTGYKCSAGVAHNKILAKLVCGLHKPNKQTILPHNSVPELYKDLPIKKIKSLGGKFGESITDELQINFMGELVQFSEKDLAKKFDDKAAKWLYNIARGIDLEPVTTRLISKSIGCCKQFPGQTALKTSEDIEHWLNELCEEISERLQKDLVENKRKAKQMVISFTQKVDKELVNSSRNHPLKGYEKEKLAQGAMDVVRRFCMKADRTYHLTFLGVSVGNFQPLSKSKDITLFFKNMLKDNKDKNRDMEDDAIESSSVGSNMEKIQISKDKTLKNGNLFFERFLNETPEFKNPSLNTKVTEDKNSLVQPKSEKNDTKTTNSFFVKFLKENPEFSNPLINKGSDNFIKHDIITENENINEESDELEEDKSSVYSASTEELNEDTKQLIYFEDVFSQTDSTKPIFRNNEKKQDSPSTSKTGYDNDRFAKSFFLNYLKKEGMLNTETRISDENLNDKNDSSDKIQETTEEIPSSPIIQKEEIGIPGPSNSSDCDNQICPECNKKIPNLDFTSHMDYHIALQIVKNEAHLYRNTEPTNKMVPSKTDKKSSTKRKKVPDKSSKSIISFLQNTASDIDDENSEMCAECSKKIKIEDISSHMDYHTARKLHLELNSNVQSSSSKKNATLLSCVIKTKKSKPTNNVRSISTFFKN